MRIELLYFDGCPSYEALLPALRQLLDEGGVEDRIELREIETLEGAERERFLGSPTVRIDGDDVEPGAGERRDYGLKCRLYRSEVGLTGIPPEGWVQAAIARAR